MLKKRAWIVAIAVGVLCLACLVGGWFTWTHLPYSRGQFNRGFLGANAFQVQTSLGGPDLLIPTVSFETKKPDGVTEYWVYKGRTYNETTGRYDQQVNLTMFQGRCSAIEFQP
jgi:hypothetical protein